jgi:hypothetical protein
MRRCTSRYRIAQPCHAAKQHRHTKDSGWIAKGRGDMKLERQSITLTAIRKENKCGLHLSPCFDSTVLRDGADRI